LKPRFGVANAARLPRFIIGAMDTDFLALGTSSVAARLREDLEGLFSKAVSLPPLEGMSAQRRELRLAKLCIGR